MKLRIKKHEKGFVVQIRKRFLFFTYWTHFISASGFPSVPWCFSSEDNAMEDMLFKIECETIKNSR